MEAVKQEGKAKPVSANDRQVGGDHYQTGGMQHWDMFGPESMIYAATKYVARWRKKNGVQDLEKALHYSEKLLEIVKRTGVYVAPKLPVDRSVVSVWGPNQGIEWPEITIIQYLMFYNTSHEIERAIAGIKYLIQQSSRATGGQSPMSERRVPRQVEKPDKKGPVPDADESRHASLYPWSVPRDRYMTMSQDRRSLLDRFYTQRGVNMLLDACVEGVTCLPRELQSCYSLITNTGSEPSYWVIEMHRVPEELREFYPRLHLELNEKELEECPRWQQGLYSQTGERDGKYRLLDRAMVWGPEL